MGLKMGLKMEILNKKRSVKIIINRQRQNENNKRKYG